MIDTSRQCATVCVSIFLGSALILSEAALAQDAVDSSVPKKVHSAKGKQAGHAHLKPAVATSVTVKAAPVDTVAAAIAASPARFDKVYGFKGWDIYFPSMGDSLLQDYGGWRSALASYGFGFLAFNINSFSLNTLNTPTVVPATSYVPSLGIRSAYPVCPNTPSSSVCAGNQLYLGQRPAYYSYIGAYLTYDMSRWGVPDGQLQLAGNVFFSSDQAYQARGLQFSALSWYQTLFDKKLELQIGYFAAGAEFVGFFVGGNFTNTFGVAAAIPIEMGLSYSPTQAPTAKVTWHLTDNVYNVAAAIRSLPVNQNPTTPGLTGNSLVDEVHLNPVGLRFTEPHTGALFLDEFGYRNEAAPGSPQTWARFGAMYNTSAFADYTRLATANTINGNSAFYFLADRQLWQEAPDSPYTAYRGIYTGLSVMYSPPSEVAYSQYYEARLYAIGLFDARPTDFISLVYNHNVFSHYLADFVNAATAPYAALDFAVPLAHHAANSVTVSYLAHLMPGVYWNVGIGYSDHPSIEYFKGQGSSLNFLTSLTTIF
jgi:porin